MSLVGETEEEDEDEESEESDDEESEYVEAEEETVEVAGEEAVLAAPEPPVQGPYLKIILKWIYRIGVTYARLRMYLHQEP